MRQSKHSLGALELRMEILVLGRQKSHVRIVSGQNELCFQRHSPRAGSTLKRRIK